MKAIMISIKPEWVAKILNGEKTIEVRRNKALASAIQKLIDKYGFADIYVYCTKDEELYKFSWSKTWYENFKRFDDICCDQAHALDSDNLNGKVIFKFRCYKVEEITNEFGCYRVGDRPHTNEVARGSCLSYNEINTYLNGSIGYAIHISDLEIFNKPKELSEFRNPNKKRYCKTCIHKGYGDCWGYPMGLDYCKEKLTKAPQSWCYVEVE